MADQDNDTSFDPYRTVYQIGYGRDLVVRNVGQSNLLADDRIEVTQEVWAEAAENLGRRRWVDGRLVPYEPPADENALIRATISRRQFYTQLALDQIISFDEADKAMGGELPALMASILGMIKDPTEQFKAKMLAKGATEFDIHQPLVRYVGSVINFDEPRLIKLWNDASAL